MELKRLIASSHRHGAQVNVIHMTSSCWPSSLVFAVQHLSTISAQNDYMDAWLEIEQQQSQLLNGAPLLHNGDWNLIQELWAVILYVCTCLCPTTLWVMRVSGSGVVVFFQRNAGTRLASGRKLPLFRCRQTNARLCLQLGKTVERGRI